EPQRQSIGIPPNHRPLPERRVLGFEQHVCVVCNIDDQPRRPELIAEYPIHVPRRIRDEVRRVLPRRVHVAVQQVAAAIELRDRVELWWCPNPTSSASPAGVACPLVPSSTASRSPGGRGRGRAGALGLLAVSVKYLG